MKCKQFIALIAITASCMLAGCRSEIDLKNIDKTAELEMGLVLPVGTIHATLNDFLGGGQVENVFVENGQLTWRDSFPDTKQFHAVKMDKDTTTKDFSLLVYTQLSDSGAISGGVVPGNDSKQWHLPFDLELTFKGINDALGNERVDSALISEASFITCLKKKDFDLEWAWIDSIVLDLGSQVRRHDGNTKRVYERGQAGGFDREMYTTVDNFSLCMMDDPSKAPSSTNVVKSAKFKTHIYFTIPTGYSVPVTTTSEITYTQKVRFIHYRAIWGYFKPSSHMFAEVLTPVGESMKSLSFLRNGTFPFSDPEIKVEITTQIAGIMRIDSCYVFAQDPEGHRTYANFDGDTIKNYVPLVGTPLDPHTSAIGASTLLYTIFDKRSDRGHIDGLFGKVPDSLGYKFKVDFDTKLSPQIRMTPEDSITMNAICTLPLKFNKGLYIDYDDTITDVNLSKYSIDSLTANVQIIDSMKATDVTLFMTATNDIRADIHGVMRCYDKAGNMVMDPSDPAKPMLLFPQDTILIAAPKFDYKGSEWTMTEPGKTTITAKLNKKQLDMFPKIDLIKFKGIIDDRSLQYTFDKGEGTIIKFTDDQGLNIKIGLTTQADVVLNLNGNKK